MSLPALCDFAAPHFLFFGDQIPPLIYYSHLPITIISLLIGLFVYQKNKRDLSSKFLFTITLFFAFWVFLDSVFWASNRSDVIMFVWSLQILIEPLIYASVVCMLYSVAEGRVPFKHLLGIFFLCLPTILLVPTKFALSGFDITSCLSVENIVGYYDYFVEAVFLIWIVVYTSDKYRQFIDKKRKNEILLLTAGSILFLVAFSSGNLIGSLTEDWNKAQIGLFGMPIFLSVLAYSIVKFKTFNIKLLGVQTLVISSWFLLLGILFIEDVKNIRIIVSCTLLLYGILGYNLIQNVKKERDQLEKIAELAANLENSNRDLSHANEKLKELDQMKSEFVSLATHQIRGPLTAIKGYASLVLDGDYGDVSASVKEAVTIIFNSCQNLVQIVSDYLDISRIEQGRMKYENADFDLRVLVETVVNEMLPNIKPLHLTLSLEAEKGKDYFINADQGKIKQVILNIIDNAIKYTAKGGVFVSLSKNKNKIMISIRDTGVGITASVLPKLFEKFTRAPDASKTNIMGTGLGLYVAKKMIEAHHGRIWVESEGKDKGSTFFVELSALHPDTTSPHGEINEGQIEKIEKFAEEL